MDKYKELREAVGKATPGPWKKMHRNNNDAMLSFHGVEIGGVFVDVPTSLEIADANYIAAANPTTIRALLDENDALVEALEHISEYWNKDRNDTAMHDALWHIIETADDALEAVKRQEGLSNGS